MQCYIIKILSSIAFASVAFVAANGQTENLTATTSRKDIYKTSQTYNEDQFWNISPAPGVASSHFLAISWHFLSVHGTMPNCDNDYVEVYLTRSNHSAGRFCSNNIGQYKPFPMYSFDGYARIHFHSDSSDIGAGFYLSYWLPNTSRLNKNCVNTDNKLRSGIMYSSGWPFSYANDSVPCIHKITTAADRETKLIFIDLDLNHKGAFPSCNSDDDYIEVRGTNSSSPSFETSSIISGKICRAATTKVVVTRSKYIYLHFNRRIGPQSTSRRGYFLGYISYDIVATAKGTTATTEGTTTTPLTTATTTKSTTTTTTTTAKRASTTTNTITSIMETVPRTVAKDKEKGETLGGGSNEKLYLNSTIGLAVSFGLFLLLVLLVVTIRLLRRKPAIPEGGPQAPQRDLEAAERAAAERVLQEDRRRAIAEQEDARAAQTCAQRNPAAAVYDEIDSPQAEQPYLVPQNVPMPGGIDNYTNVQNNGQQANSSIRGQRQPAPQGRHVDEGGNEIARNESAGNNVYYNELIVDNNPSNPDRNHESRVLGVDRQNAENEIDFKGPGRNNRGFSN